MERIAMTSDAALVEASLRGEHAAFGRLVARYQDVVCAVSYSSTGDWSLSEDVAQDTFIAAWRQLGQLRETRTLRAWLCGIARNLARKARRRGKDTTALDDDLPAAGDSPFDAAAQAEVDRVVRDALARVPETYREVLVLYYRENRAIGDVAAAVGISEDAALQRLARGRRYLADGVHALVERSLRGPRKNLVGGVLVAIAGLAIPSRVDASPTAKGPSTMLKLALAAVALTATTTTTYFAVRAHGADSADTHAAAAAAPTVVEPAHVARGSAIHLPRPAAPPPSEPTPSAPPSLEPQAPTVLDAATIARTHLDRGPSRGPANAKVDIVVFQDAMCTYCGTALGTIDQLFDEYPNQLRLVVKQLPVHAAARLAAEASFAADAQGKFWELHDLMFQHQDDLSRDALIAYATQAGLDVPAFTAALDNHTYAPAVAADVDTAKEIGVDATPTFVIGDTVLVGARPVASFRALIDEQLAK